MRTSDVALEVDNLSVTYGHVEAVRGASLTVGKGEVVALLGANGAGKTSLLRALSGLAPRRGAVRVMGTDVSGLAAHKITRNGLVHVPEGRRMVASLSVKENLELAAMASKRRKHRDLEEVIEQVYAIFPKLKQRHAQPSGLMSGGEQQMLAIGRGLMARPEVLLLDEPSMGLAPIMIGEVYEALQGRAGTIADVSILLAEQSARLALGVSEHCYILSRGRVVYSGPSSEVTDEVTAEAYLGGAALEGEPKTLSSNTESE